MAIRTVRRDEAASLWEIRLRALGDAPQAYFASLESEEGLPLSYWEDWGTSEDKVVFVAEEDGGWLGMAGAFVHPDKRGTVSLWWLWLAPSARHRRLGFVPTGKRRSIPRIRRVSGSSWPGRSEAFLRFCPTCDWQRCPAGDGQAVCRGAGSDPSTGPCRRR